MNTQQLETLFLLLQRYPDLVVSCNTRHWHIAMFRSNSPLLPTGKKVAIVGIIDNPSEMIGFLMFGVVR